MSYPQNYPNYPPSNYQYDDMKNDDTFIYSRSYGGSGSGYGHGGGGYGGGGGCGIGLCELLAIGAALAVAAAAAAALAIALMPAAAPAPRGFKSIKSKKRSLRNCDGFLDCTNLFARASLGI